MTCKDAKKPKGYHAHLTFVLFGTRPKCSVTKERLWKQNLARVNGYELIFKKNFIKIPWVKICPRFITALPTIP